MESSHKRIGQSTSTLLFKSIPPERVGLDGEYDHHGLAKRVMLVFRQEFAFIELNRLRVTQRGAVVIVVGQILNQKMLVKLVNLAMSTSGAADVEVNGVSVGYSLKNYLELKPSRETLLALQKLLAS